MARQIGQMLNSREPKIVNGPQILDKYVGESEANIRRLFEDAEEEEKRLGPNSGTFDVCISVELSENKLLQACTSSSLTRLMRSARLEVQAGGRAPG